MAKIDVLHDDKISMIGPKCWRNSTINNLKMSQTMIKNAHKKGCVSRQIDPLPTYREICVEQTNNKLLCYMRRTRGVVVKLHEVLGEANEEIKSLIKCKENLESLLENVRIDGQLNKTSIKLRNHRPEREKIGDGADNLLDAEKMLINRIKKIVEKQLKETQSQLQELKQGRKMLLETIKERNRVLDLFSHAASSVLSNPGYFCPPPKTDGEKMAFGLSREPDLPVPKPLSPYTPEASDAIDKATYETELSKTLRKKIATCIGMCEMDLKEAHCRVNRGILRRVAETDLLTRHLYLNNSRNRVGVHRSQRHCELTNLAQGYTYGPVDHKDLTVKERLDRPMVKIYQRHCGGQVLEPQNLIEANSSLEKSAAALRKNVTMLQLTQMNLKDDINDKEMAMKIDNSIVRLRQRRSDYRWRMEEKELIQ